MRDHFHINISIPFNSEALLSRFRSVDYCTVYGTYCRKNQCEYALFQLRIMLRSTSIAFTHLHRLYALSVDLRLCRLLGKVIGRSISVGGLLRKWPVRVAIVISEAEVVIKSLCLPLIDNLDFV